MRTQSGSSKVIFATIANRLFICLFFLLQVMMFICLAVGMDDAYVIIDHAERSRSAENEWTINLVTTMVGAGSSTLMTTLTSVTAFSVAAITSTLEGIRIFSINTAVAIFLVWVTAVTIFSAWVVLSDRLTPPTRSDLSRSLKLRWQALWDFLTALGSCGKSGVYDAECAATPGKSPPAPEVNTSISNTTNGKSGVVGTHTEGWAYTQTTSRNEEVQWAHNTKQVLPSPCCARSCDLDWGHDLWLDWAPIWAQHAYTTSR